MASGDPERPSGRGGQPSGGGTVTMRDVARLAGVSVATVSHVVNDRPGARIGAAARARVRAAVAELGYRQNMLARTLSTGSSRFLGLVADSIATTPFAGQIIHGAQDEAWRHGYVLLVANTDGHRQAEADSIAMMLEHQVHGVLYSTWYHQEVDLPASLDRTDTVLVNCFASAVQRPAVVPDEVQGGRSATELLVGAGHERIAFINTVTPSPAQEQRLLGYEQALDAAGLRFDAALVFMAESNQGGGFDTAAAVVASGATGIFCHNDRVAMGLYDGLREVGLRVPDDMSVVGFDNQEVIAAHLRPPLTTIALPHYELGARGVRVLLGLEEASDGRLLVPCPVVERSSVTDASR